MVDLVRNDLIPRLMELGFGFATFFGRIVLPITVIVSSALQALLPSFDAVGNRVSGVGDKLSSSKAETPAVAPALVPAEPLQEFNYCQICHGRVLGER